MPKPPIVYTPDVETIEPDEAETTEGLRKVFTQMVDKVHEKDPVAERGAHAKGHSLLQGELVVRSDLPPEFAQGIFQPGKKYPVLLRFSVTAGDVLPDSVSLPRGLAIKAIGVDGERLPGSEGDVTQDFLFASGPAFITPGPKSFLRETQLLATTTDHATWAKELLSKVLRPIEAGLEALGLESANIKFNGGFQPINPVGDRYGTQAPYRFGPYIAKLDVVPESENFKAKAHEKIDVDASPTAIREHLNDMFAREGGAFTLRAQLCRDLKDNPIEDPNVPWPEEDNPYVPLATITVGPQTSWSSERAAVVNTGTYFSPWHGVEAHRPIGNLNRARRTVYPLLQAHRGQLNGCPVHEPRELPRLD